MRNIVFSSFFFLPGHHHKNVYVVPTLPSGTTQNLNSEFVFSNERVIVIEGEGKKRASLLSQMFYLWRRVKKINAHKLYEFHSLNMHTMTNDIHLYWLLKVFAKILFRRYCSFFVWTVVFCVFFHFLSIVNFTFFSLDLIFHVINNDNNMNKSR